MLIQPVISRETRIVPIRPVYLVPAQTPPEDEDNPRPTAPMRAVEPPRKTIPAQTIPNNPANNSERIPKEFRTIPESAPTIPTPAQNGPLAMPEVEDESDVGRKRKYEDTGIYGDISIKDLVLFRHIKARHFPDLSADMREWYEHFYFVAPQVGESSYRGRDYEQHKRAYERGKRWIAAHDASTQAVGHSGAVITPLPRRANG